MSDIKTSSQIFQSQSINNRVMIPCAFHKDQSITNFCSNLQCLLPMCPVCVAIHSEEHRQGKTHGQFHSIQQVVENINEILFRTNKALEELSEQYTQDYWNKEKILDSCKQNLNNYKKKLMKQIQRKFQQIQYKISRKVLQFQDTIHDKYKQMQSQIQYVYDSLNKQRQQFQTSNQKILKNLIQFYGQRKQIRIKEWVSKFQLQVTQLKNQNIKITCNDQVFNLFKNLDYYFSTQQFRDEENDNFLSNGKQFIASNNTKRKKVEVPQWPQWTEEKENNMTSRNPQNYNQNGESKSYYQETNRMSIIQKNSINNHDTANDKVRFYNDRNSIKNIIREQE